MNSKQNTTSLMTSTRLMTIALSAIFFMAAYSVQPEQIYAQVEAQTITNTADSIGWVQSLDDAVALSASSGKPIMLVFSGSDWCSYCQLLEQEVLQTPEFETWSSDNVIKVMVDFPKFLSQPAEVALQNQNLKQHFAGNLKGYPTVLMVDADGSVIGRTGYVAGGPTAWISKADAILRQPTHHLAVTSNLTH